MLNPLYAGDPIDSAHVTFLPWE